VGVDQAGHADRFLAGGVRWQVEVALDPQPVAGLEGEARSGRETGRVHDGRQRMGQLSGFAPWRGLRHGQEPEIVWGAIAAADGQMADASGIQPTTIQTPSNGLTTAWRPGPGRRAVRRQIADQQVHEPIADLHVSEARSRRAMARAHVAPAAARLAVLALARRENRALLPSAEIRTTWNQPSRSDTISRPEPSGSQRGPVSQAPRRRSAAPGQ
jgi:hypothetical protein